MSDGGKGSRRRPQQVEDEIFWANFDLIFGKEKGSERKQREDVDGIPHCGDDVRTETHGSDIQTSGESGT